ncbi:MAG: HAD family phosphatase [Clostridiales bacterium]|nr:HAD family phosphatase [Clostridiales bacterium]
MIRGIKGAIFDLDGTLVDSMGIWARVDIEFLRERGIEVPVDLSEEIQALTFEDCAKYFKRRFGLPETIEEIMDEWNKMAYHEYANNVKLKPGVRDYLSYLKEKDIKIGLATSNIPELLYATLKNNRILHYFDSISTVSEVSRNKNFPDIFLLAAKKMDLKPSECLVFEDILPAILSAKSAGMKTVGVYDKHSEYDMEEIKEHADLFIYNFECLLKTG